MQYFITLDLARIIVKDYLASQQSTLWGRSFDLQNNIDSATEFVISLIVELLQFAEDNTALYQDLVLSSEETEIEADDPW